MTIYQFIAKYGPSVFSKHALMKHTLNLSPMYRRSTGRLTYVSKDLSEIRIRIRLTWRNRNFVNTIFGGSMFAAVDPIPMAQLMPLLGDQYIVWDKAAEIKFKLPARETLYASFTWSAERLEDIRQQVAQSNEIEIVHQTLLTDKAKSKEFCEVTKRIYIADKAFYKSKKTC